MACALSALLAGCASFGAKTVPLDRFEYSNALSESWMRQNLLNIVKVRYLSPPIFVDVSSVVSGYSLQSTVSAGGTLANHGAPDVFTLGGSSTYTDRPTITYVPLTGNKFIKGLMTPLAPDSVFFTIQAGWPADAILTTCLLSINGIRNTSVSIAGGMEPDPRFIRVVELMRGIQLEGGIAFRIKQDPNKQQTSVFTVASPDASQKALDKRKELRDLLGLSHDATEFKLVFGSVAANDKEIAVQTRSLLQIMAIMASEVDAPPEHIARGIVIPDPKHSGLRLIQILSSKDKPEDAFVAVPYHGYWFWIDDRDLKSKRTFSFMMLLFTLADTGEPQNLPLITIPAQ
jgi:hypothetical protein